MAEFEGHDAFWRRLFHLSRSRYTPRGARLTDFLGCVLPADYETRLRVTVPRPPTALHFQRGPYHEPREYSENRERGSKFTSEAWRKPSVYRTSGVTFYGNAQGILPYQADRFHKEYMAYQQSTLLRRYRHGCE